MLTRDLADDLAKFIEFANRDKELAMTNPENYVFFIAHLYHMFGTNSAKPGV